MEVYGKQVERKRTLSVECPGAPCLFQRLRGRDACPSTNKEAAAVGRSLFPFYAPVFVLHGSADCPLRSDPEGIAKRRAAPKGIHRLRFCSLGVAAELGWTSLVAPNGNRLLRRTGDESSSFKKRAG
ncbi:hypothetical protein [Brevibacillus borstelensis]|uniref:hypothetical protein n=1 Tax=Brevibacillus borstelensis TaxID=45462 RepID=UPI0030BBDB7D